MEVEMKIKGLMIDPITQMPIIILRDPGSNAVLPIWVGIFEANAIALQIEKISTPRPMTHDLLRDIIRSLHAEVKRILIWDLKENTFYAKIFVQSNHSEVIIDSRPSDAIALALRTGSPIFVDSSVIEKAKSTDLAKDAGESERLRKWLENLDPDEMGKYEM
ncbi:MAG: bifunctional nuclease family protein [Acidobacteria bacterium]|nr:bifunctional nuclease family protein [Acidobacteriota bacterium]